MYKEASRERAAKAAFTVVKIGLGVWVGLILTDVLAFVWAYRSARSLLEEYSLSLYLARFLAAVFAGVVAYFAGTVLWKIAKRDRKWVLIVAGIMAACFAVMYFIASPYTSGHFNPFSGEARATYLKSPDGTIKLFPKGLKYDPESGQKLKELDTAIAAEYRRQQAARTSSSSPPEPKPVPKLIPPKSDRIASRWKEDNLEFWVEGVHLEPYRTVLFLACQGMDGKQGLLRPNAEKAFATYLADPSGQTYDLFDETIEPNVWRDVESGEHIHVRYVRVDEVYRFTLVFLPVPEGITKIKLHIPWLGQALDLSSAFAKAEKAPSKMPW